MAVFKGDNTSSTVQSGSSGSKSVVNGQVLIEKNPGSKVASSIFNGNKNPGSKTNPGQTVRQVGSSHTPSVVNGQVISVNAGPGQHVSVKQSKGGGTPVGNLPSGGNVQSKVVTTPSVNKGQIISDVNGVVTVNDHASNGGAGSKPAQARVTDMSSVSPIHNRPTIQRAEATRRARDIAKAGY